MKAKNVLDKLKDLKLRRWGPAEYTEAKNSNEGDDGCSGDDSNSDVFFVPATIQPKYFVGDNDAEPVEIKNYTPNIFTQFLYNKEDIISLGVKEGALNSLPQVTIAEAYDDNNLQSPTKSAPINEAVFRNITVLQYMQKEGGPANVQSNVNIYSSNVNGRYVVYKISDDIFLILEHSEKL